MGSSCSVPCRPIDPDAALEFRRADSPDPVMYDLMRKSIQATTTATNHGSLSTSETNAPTNTELATTTTTTTSTISPRRKLVGQQHLLFRHANNSNCNFGGTTVDPVKPVSAGSAAAAAAAAPVSSSSNISTSGSGAKGVVDMWLPEDTTGTFLSCPTRLVIRRRAASSASSSTTTIPNHPANGTTTETHIYAIRYPEGTPDQVISEQVIPRPESARQQEQYPTTTKKQLFKAPPSSSDATDAAVVDVSDTTLNPIDSAVGHPATTGSSVAVQSLPSAVVVRCSLSDGLDVYSPIAMGTMPRQEVVDWVTVSDEHDIYVADVGLTANQCDYIVKVCEQVCRGQYAAYTYAKQTLGCREYPLLAQTCFHPVHTITRDIIERLGSQITKQKLQLDDREPHIVKYDVTKKERQKLDMHTDKSEWTFLIALSNGCGVDYEGGGTYFECVDATVHIQRGHALVFPGKLRHCGQKITAGLRFLLVGFLVDKANPPKDPSLKNTTTTTSAAVVPAVKGLEPSGTSMSVDP